MIEFELLAHRGLWKQPAEKNSFVAFQRAFDAGIGVETDLRDEGDRIVISHDPPGSDGRRAMTLEAFLTHYRDSDATGTLALNIKADGLCGAVMDAMNRFEIKRYFVFDMSFPDMLSYLKQGVCCFVRQSEWETPLSVAAAPPYGPSTGIWLDSFTRIWYSMDLVRDHLIAGRDVCLVSPELHGRDRDSLWIDLKTLITTNLTGIDAPCGRLMLCTDFSSDWYD